MRRYQRRVERLFAAAAAFIIRCRYLVVAVMLAGGGLLAAHIGSLTFDTSNESFLHPDDPIMVTYNEFRDQFGRDDMLLLAVHSEEIFSFSFLEKLQALHDELENELPFVNDIISLANARSTLGRGDVLLVDDLLATFPSTEAELEALRERVMANPLYLNQLISEDGRFTTIAIESDVYTGTADTDLFAGFEDEEDGAETGPGASGRFISDEENSRFVEAARAIVDRHHSDGFEIYMAGSPAVMHAIKQSMKADVQTFMKLAVAVIAVCLFVMFRRVSGVVLPLVVVALAVSSTIGLMALLGVAFKLPTTILPSFLLAVGVGASVHLLSLTFLFLRQGQTKHEAIVGAYAHSGLAIVMTSLTTAAGLASFSFAAVAPIAELGIFSSVGVLLSLLYTLTVLPALLAIVPLRVKPAAESPQQTRLDRLLYRIAGFAVSRHRGVLVVSALIIAVSIAGAVQIRFAHNVLIWLPEDLHVRQSTEVIDRELRGSVVLEVLLDTGLENGLYDREVLLAIDRVTAQLERDHREKEVFVGKTIAVTTILKEIHQALHANDPDFYRIPENENLIPQEFLLFENSGSDDLEDVVDSQFRTARITLKVPWQDALLYTPFIGDAEKRFSDEFGDRSLAGGEEMTVTVTGLMSLFGRIVTAAIYSAAQSYLAALVIITVLMVLLIGDLRLGFLSMIPNLTPILAVIGLMGWAAVPLDMFTMLIASIAIGLAVDDTIHFMYNFKRYFDATGDVLEAVEQTLHTAGRAMLTTSVVLSIGFFIFTFASMNNLFYFGLLTGLAILLALAADLLLAPALMALAMNRRMPETPSAPINGE